MIVYKSIGKNIRNKIFLIQLNAEKHVGRAQQPSVSSNMKRLLIHVSSLLDFITNSFLVINARINYLRGLNKLTSVLLTPFNEVLQLPSIYALDRLQRKTFRRQGRRLKRCVVALLCF